MTQEQTKPTPATPPSAPWAGRPASLYLSNVAQKPEPRHSCRAAPASSPRRAFSLAEMMIAIVILGLGLLMAASMFPVAWLRARDLAEFTNQTTATDAAQTTVRLLSSVATINPAAPPPFTQTSFLGDADEDGANADVFVHPFHLENLLADPLGGADLTPVGDFILGADGTTIWVDPNLAAVKPPLQVVVHERILPPLPVWPNDGGVADAQWIERLRSRRFAWSVLHKLDVAPTIPSETRSFTMYFVTLRRTQATHRFARQNPSFLTATPTSFGPEEDVRLPVPWLINLKVLGNWDPAGLPPHPDPTGVPSEAEANPAVTYTDDARLIAQMLAPDSVLIDRLTGDMYTVKQHRFTGNGSTFDYQATITLDREINVGDYGLNPLTDPVAVDVLADEVTPGGDLRDFWVFPPPVLADRPQAGFPVFDGRQPVVGIEVRQMYFTP